MGVFGAQTGRGVAERLEAVGREGQLDRKLARTPTTRLERLASALRAFADGYREEALKCQSPADRSPRGEEGPP